MKLLPAIALLSLSACASVASGSSQDVFVSTNPVTGASCKLTNPAGSWTVDSTPAAVTIQREKEDLLVKCNKANLKGEARVVSGVEDVAFGNILAGGVVGVIVDRNTGAAFNYPNKIDVPISAEGSSIVIKPPKIEKTDTPQYPNSKR